MAILLPCAAMAIALLLHVAQWVTSWISTALAQARGGAGACSDLVTDFGVDPDAVEIIDRAPFGFVCQASTYDGGTAMIEHSGATSAMFITSAGLAALGSAVLLGVLLAFTVTDCSLRPDPLGVTAAWIDGHCCSSGSGSSCSR